MAIIQKDGAKMREEKIDILSDEVLKKADAICFTSNGIVKKDGCLTMEAGVAKMFLNKYPWIAKELGDKVSKYGNHVWMCSNKSMNGPWILSFPTKNDWRNLSDIGLIIQSANELMIGIKEMEWKNVYLPRPGIGLGGLSWEKEVKPAIKDILDDGVVICYL